jgi:hypothetical protein
MRVSGVQRVYVAPSPPSVPGNDQCVLYATLGVPLGLPVTPCVNAIGNW